MESLSEHGLVAEVADGTYSFKNKISAASVKLLWDKLSRFIGDALKQQKGVLVPNLGTFIVGPVVGEPRKKVRPAFSLLETRYSGVSQERVKYSVGGRCPVMQPNYGLLATAAAIHRGACQRLVIELMQRLGVHILSGRPISVMFPGVGRLYTNKAGRIQFDFYQLLREYFELERERVIPEMPHEPAVPLEEPPVARLVKGLQHVHLHNPPVIKDRPTTGKSAATAARDTSPSSRVRRQAHAPYKGDLLDLWKLCKRADRINSGCVPRLQLEQWLHKECAQVLRQVAAATVLELLTSNTYGRTGKHILYKPFLDQLEAAVGNVSPVELSPQSVQSPRRIVEVRIDSPSYRRQQDMQQEDDEHGDEDEVASPSENEQQGHIHQAPYAQPQPFAAAAASHRQYPPGLPPRQNTQGFVTPHLQQGQEQRGQHPVQGQHRPHGAYPPSPLILPQTPAQAWQGQAHGREVLGADSGVPYHYYQNQISPRSRREFDKFNRLHFENLEQARGRDYKHRAVTPKVGEDELNRQQFHAIRQAGDAVTPAQVLGLHHDTPYSRATPQAIANIGRHRGSPGPKPQILTLAHEPPQQQVPGLPPYSQPTPRQRPQSAWEHAPQEEGSPPISQYDIINEEDPVQRQRKRAELAQVLQRNWSEQIREKERILEGIAEAAAQWPYAPVRQPNDKRPVRAVSRPQSAFR